MIVPDVIAHCDWSLQPNKRKLAFAEYKNGRWVICQTESVPADPLDLLKRWPNKRLFLGLDLPLGVPQAWAERVGLRSFRQLLQQLVHGDERWHAFFDVAETPADVSPLRPFYPRRPGGTKLQHLVDGLNLHSADQLRRMCDRPTGYRRAAAPLFWTMGAQQVGKSALSAWRTLLLPLVAEYRAGLALWPFDGELFDLIALNTLVLAEVYPAEMYQHIGITFPMIDGKKTGKRSQMARQHNAAAIFAMVGHLDSQLDAGLQADIKNGFGDSADGEDRFDALIGLLGMLLVIAGELDQGRPPSEVAQVEGWLLGLSAPSIQMTQAIKKPV